MVKLDELEYKYYKEYGQEGQPDESERGIN